MKLTCLKLANAIKVDRGEESYFIDAHYDMTLTGMVIRIASKRADGKATYTTLMNTVYWQQEDVQQKPETLPVPPEETEVRRRGRPARAVNE